jgi:hypothetical protein
MAKRGGASAPDRGRAGIVVDTATDVIVDAAGVVTPIPGNVARKLRKIEKRLAAARKTESKRLHQLAAAQSRKRRKQLA